MTSVYDEKIYPQIPATAPIDTDTQAYRLKKIEEVEEFLRNKVKERDKLVKRFKRRTKTSEVINLTATALATSAGAATITTSATVVGLPVGIPLGAVSIILGSGAATSHIAQKIFNFKTKKNDKIKTLAESKLDTIIRFLKSLLKGYDRVDIVADTYRDFSIKAGERVKRGSSSRLIVKSLECKTLQNVPKFFTNNENKTRLTTLTFNYICLLYTSPSPRDS